MAQAKAWLYRQDRLLSEHVVRSLSPADWALLYVSQSENRAIAGTQLQVMLQRQLHRERGEPRQ